MFYKELFEKFCHFVFIVSAEIHKLIFRFKIPQLFVDAELVSNGRVGGGGR